MILTDVIGQTVGFVKKTLLKAEGGHDWWHIFRVWQNAKLIAEEENVDILIIELAALLHDIADAKFHDGNESIAPEIARDFLTGLEVNKAVIDHVVKIIENISFRKSFEGVEFDSPELRVVQDADRLDALGAIGIARAFSYGGHKQRQIYDPTIPIEAHLTKEKYVKSTAPTIHHFYEKLLLLKDQIHTVTGKKMAQERHDFLSQYLEQFYREWPGDIPHP